MEQSFKDMTPEQLQAIIDKASTALKEKVVTQDEPVVKTYRQIRREKFVAKQISDKVKEFDKTKLKKVDETRVSPTYVLLSEWHFPSDDNGRKTMCQDISQRIQKLDLTNDRYMFSFTVRDTEVSVPLTPEVADILQVRLEHGRAIWDQAEKSIDAYNSDPEEYDIPDIRIMDNFNLIKLINPGGKKIREGAFFYYYHRTYLDLKKYQMYSSKREYNEDKNKENCFIHCLRASGYVDESTINKIKLDLKTNMINRRVIKQIANKYNLYVVLRYPEDKKNTHNWKFNVCNDETDKSKQINIIEMDKHYFLRERLPITKDYCKWCIENHITINSNDKRATSRFRKDRNSWSQTKEDKYYFWNDKFVEFMHQHNLLTPIPFNDLIETTHYDKTIGEYDLHYDENQCTEEIKPKAASASDSEESHTIWYSDFEASTDGKMHIPFMNCLSNEDGTIEKTFCGITCGQQLLEFLSHQEKPIVYFHNLGYDANFLIKHGAEQVIQKGTRMYSLKVKYNHKTIMIRDTLALLEAKLKVLPSMFNLDSGDKEIFPYNYYSSDKFVNNDHPIGHFSEITDLSPEDLEQMKKNCQRIGCSNGNDFDMIAYAEYYCKQDVNILRQAFNKFRTLCLENLKIDPLECLTAASLANKWFEQNVYYDHKLYKYGGNVRDFIGKAVYGGRCMTRANKRWHTKVKLSDFDAVSLYPSAMSRLYTVKGKPKVLEYLDSTIVYNEAPKWAYDAYVVEIEIVKVNKHYDFPLVVVKDDQGNNLNTDDNAIITGKRIVVCDIMLEDLVEFQKLEYKLIRGYYWNEGKDYTIQKMIRKLFQLRLDYKKEHNPMQALIKLLMNSCYGKTIQKPIEFEKRFIKAGHKCDQYLWNHFYQIIETVMVHDSDITQFKVRKPIDKHKAFSLLGVHVLAMSKRIMNEVMCTAEDIGCHIYYQDTDSMHIITNEIPKLEAAYREKYHRELIGTNLGQFHPDFDSLDGHNCVPYAVESYFIGKKLYLDHLQDDEGGDGYHVRGKGLTQKSIKIQAERCGGYLNLYQRLFCGRAVTFNLADGEPSFELNKDFTIHTRETFNRRVKATLPFGKDEYSI